MSKARSQVIEYKPWIPDRIFAGLHVIQSTVNCFSSVSLPAVIHFLRLQGPVHGNVPGQGMTAQLVPLMGVLVVTGMLWMWSAFEAWSGRKVAFFLLAMLSFAQVGLATWLGPVVYSMAILHVVLAVFALFRVVGAFGPRLVR